MSFRHFLFALTFFMYDRYLRVLKSYRKVQSQLQIYVLNDTFTEINFYHIPSSASSESLGSNPYQLYNNSTWFRLLFLSMLKRVFSYDITTRYRDLETIDDDFNLNLRNSVYSIKEIVYFKDGNKSRFFSKKVTNLSVIENTLKNHPNLPHHNNKYLHAAFNNDINVTNFINSHLFCFTAENGITVSDLYVLYMEKHDHNPEEKKRLLDVTLTLIEDDSLVETVLNDNEKVVLI